MKQLKNIKQSLATVMFSITALMVLYVVLIVIINHIYSFSATEAHERHRLETLQIKKDINLQMLTDRENLSTMANFASKLHSDGEGYDMFFKSFNEIGLISKIGILLPDNTLVTDSGTHNVTGELDFAAESQKGEYISGKVKDITREEQEIIVSSVPIKDENGGIAGILYGVIDLINLNERYADDAAAFESDLIVADSITGDIIIDTSKDYHSNLSDFSTFEFYDESYDKFITDIADSYDGDVSYISPVDEEIIYVNYVPLEIASWHVVLMKHGTIMFADAIFTENYLALSSIIIVFIMMIYLLSVFIAERKKSIVSLIASDIRKNLLGINQQFDKIYDALRRITDFAKGRSTFVIDTYGEDYNYVLPGYGDSYMNVKEKEFFVSKLLLYVSKIPMKIGNSVTGIKITRKDLAEKGMTDFLEFFKKHGIDIVYCSVVSNSGNNVSVIGVINPRNQRHAVNLIREISVCLTMAIYNQKHLVMTETMAVSDALTGAANRMSYKNDVCEMDKKDTSSVCCVYIDVNELNYFNNQYGHASGDRMLIFVAETLSDKFSSEKLYRMGGDEFLIFVQNMTYEEICRKMSEAIEKIEEKKYHISVGIRSGEAGMSPEELVNEAEKAMYEEKAKYYQNKHARKIINLQNRKFKTGYTGIREIDAYMSVLSMRFFGVFCVTHNTDEAVQVLSPSYFSEILDKTSSFTETLKKYIHDIVCPEYHRQMLSFVEYEALESLIATGISPSITYTKIDGEKVTLSVYANPRCEQDGIDTVWTFEKVDGE